MEESDTDVQKCQRRLLQLLPFKFLAWLAIGPELRRRYSSWVVAGSSGVVVLLFVLELSRSVCRTPAETATLLLKISRSLCATLMQYVGRGFKPKFPKWTLRFELVRGTMRTVANTHGERMVDITEARVNRWHSELFGSFVGWFSRRHHGLSLEPVHFNGLEHLWLKPSSTETRGQNRLTVLFFHGGGYAALSPRMYIPFGCDLLTAIKQDLAAKLDNTNDVTVEVFLANYRKVPEYQFPAPVEDAVAMYEYLLQHEKLDPSQIIFAGDSAGGGLVMSALMRIRDGLSSWKPKLPPPLAAMVMCPLADLTGDEDKATGQECVLSPSVVAACVESYHPTREEPSKWLDASPVHCNLRELPPVLIQSASFDYLYQHSLRLAAKAKADGVTNWEIDTHEGVTHVFMVFPGFVLPYARVGVHRMAAFAAKQFLDSHMGKRCSSKNESDSSKADRNSESATAITNLTSDAA